MPPRIDAIGRKLTKPASVTPGSARTSRRHARVERFARRRRGRTRGIGSARPQRQHALGAEAGIDAPERSTARESAARPTPAARPTRRSRRRRAPSAAAPSGRRPRARPRAGRRDPDSAPTRSTGARPKAMPVSAGQRRSRTAARAGRPSACSAIGSVAGTSRAQQRHRDDGDRDAERAADAGQQQALGHQLADQALAAGAHRRAHGQLAAALERAGEQQVRQVGAGDQQHARRPRRQREQQQPRLLRDLVARAGSRAAPSVLVLFRDTAAPARAAITSISACACSSVTPRRSRPTASSQLLVRSDADSLAR